MKTREIELLLTIGYHAEGGFGVFIEQTEAQGGAPVACIYRGSKEECEKYIDEF